MSRSYKAQLDEEEQQLRMQQMEVDIRQKQQALEYFRRQFYVNVVFAVSALVTAIFAGFKAIFGH